MPIQGKQSQYLNPVDRRTLRFVDGGGVAVVDIGVEALVDFDATPVLDLPDGRREPAESVPR